MRPRSAGVIEVCVALGAAATVGRWPGRRWSSKTS